MKKIVCPLVLLCAILISCNSEQSKIASNSIAQEKKSTVDSSIAENKSGDSIDQIQMISNEHPTEEGRLQSASEIVKKENSKPGEQSIIEKPPVSLKAEAKKFCDFFKTYEEPSQFYTVPAHEVKNVNGKAGTIITVNAEDLTTLANQPVDDSIEVELKELISQQQLLKTNTQTVCNGKQLVSGGAYYINLKCKGQPVKLKPGRSLAVKFPKFTDAPMTLFSGYRDSLGQMQWKQRNQSFKPDGPAQAWRDTRNTKIEYEGEILIIDTLAKRKPKQQTAQEKQRAEAYSKLYAAMEIQNLGWINCDRFYNISDKTNLSVKFNETPEVLYVSIYLVFNDINSILQTHYGIAQNNISNPGFTDIPVGANARVVAFALKGDKMMAYTTPIVVKKNETIAISLKETSEEELNTLLNRK